jgi:hypothetical protein
MITTGSKLFYGLSALALAAFLLFGFLQEWNALAVVGLASATVAFAFLGGLATFIRDGGAPPGDAAAAAESPAAQPSPARSVSPIVGAIGAGLVVLGLVTDQRWFVAGLVFALIALVDWTVQAWAARASGDDAYNDEVRDRTLQPLQFPLLGALGLGVIIFSFSRIMLTTDTDLGPVIFIAAAAIITIFGFIFAARRRPGRHVVASLCVIGVLGIVVPGVWAAAEGEREELAHEDEHFEEERRQCGEETNAADDDAPGSVSAKSATTADVVLSGNALYASQSGRNTDRIYLQRNTPSTILFKNDNGEEDIRRRLNAVFLTYEDGVLVQTTVCTNAIDDGKVSFMTFTIPVPSKAARDGKEFKLMVPGIEGAEIKIQVP